MFLTRIRISVAVALLAGCLAVGAAGVFAQQGPAPTGKKTTPAGASGKTVVNPGAAENGPAPSYVRRSRKMIVERLEQELTLAEQRLDLTTANVRSPSDPEVVRARKTVQTLAGLLARIDAVLVEAVDDFPTIFDFSNAPRRQAASAKPAAEIPEALSAPSYDEHTLPRAADRLESLRELHAAGQVSKAQLDREIEQFEALKARIDADIARAADRVEWARRMLEKGYVSRSQYEAEVLKHYDALKARIKNMAWQRTPESRAVSEQLLKEYEQYKELLWYSQHEHERNPAAETKPGTPAAKPSSQPAEKPAGPKGYVTESDVSAEVDITVYTEATPPAKSAAESAHIKRNTELTTPAKSAAETAPRTTPAKPEPDPRRAE